MEAPPTSDKLPEGQACGPTVVQVPDFFLSIGKAIDEFSLALMNFSGADRDLTSEGEGRARLSSKQPRGLACSVLDTVHHGLAGLCGKVPMFLLFLSLVFLCHCLAPTLLSFLKAPGFRRCGTHCQGGRAGLMRGCLRPKLGSPTENFWDFSLIKKP